MTSKNYNKKSKKYCKQVQNQLEVHAMMRSGQHAIIFWMFRLIKEPIYFHNDILCHNDDRVYIDRGHWYNIGRGKKPPIHNFPWYAYNLEDISIKDIKQIKKKYKKALFVAPFAKHHKVLILRDPFNLFASRHRFLYKLNSIREKDGRKPMKRTQRTNANSEISWFDDRAANRWKEYAKEYLGITNFLRNNRKIMINYNFWFADKRYRMNLMSKEFGAQQSDLRNDGSSQSRLNVVAKNGYGSSFDDLTMNGRAQQMDVLNRWKHFVKNDQFRSLFEDKELIDLSSKIYPGLTKNVLKKLRL